MPPSRNARTSSPSTGSGARAAWRDMQKSLDPQRLVFIGETSASTTMTVRRGRCERAKRRIARAHSVAGRRQLFWPRCGPMACPLPGSSTVPSTARSSLADVEQVLVPALSPGEIAMMDNSPPASPTVMPVGASSRLRPVPINAPAFEKPSKPRARRRPSRQPTVRT